MVLTLFGLADWLAFAIFLDHEVGLSKTADELACGVSHSDIDDDLSGVHLDGRYCRLLREESRQREREIKRGEESRVTLHDLRLVTPHTE